MYNLQLNWFGHCDNLVLIRKWEDSRHRQAKQREQLDHQNIRGLQFYTSLSNMGVYLNFVLS